jgi:non-ribosomal peptide synthase protein (TIGR01720 family)
MRELESHHDALRMRFERREGGWEQRCVEPGAEAPLRRVDLGDVERSKRGRTIEGVADEAQRSLDLERGPVWRAVLFERGAGGGRRLLVVVHHLVVDGVSWRVLLEDLETCCAQLEAGERPRLPAKTTSFQRWSERLLEYAESGGAREELGHWRGVVQRNGAGVPVDHPRGEERNTVATARSVRTALDEEQTRRLLQEVPSAYRTQIGDVLLSAVVEALAAWTRREEILIELEGHGREDLFEGVDLSRTVGWFTTIYPVRLRREKGGWGELLKGVKEQLRSVPQRGIGYGVLRYLRGEELQSGAEVSFNYLGQFDQVLGDGGLFGPAPEGTGVARSEGARRAHLLDVNALIAGGRLQVEWTYSEAVHARKTVEAVARRFEEALRGLIEHCRSGAGGYTPSDFPLAGLDADALERLVGLQREET